MTNQDGPLLSLLVEWVDRKERGEPATPEEICADHPELLEQFRRRAHALSLIEREYLAEPEELTTEHESRTASVAGSPSDPKVVDRYRIDRFLAAGGLGEVHVATDAELGRPVALKRIKGERRREPQARRRFLREAMITASLEHPGIVPVHGLVRDPQGHPFYAMRLIEGESLRDAVLRLHDGAVSPQSPDEPAPPPRSLRDLLNRFVAACNAMAYAHSRSVVHRDLKPANIMLGAFGETYVVDWGLATLIGRPADAPAPSPAGFDEPESPLEPTRALGIAGTPAYMAPEQAVDPHGSIAPAADVYSLGATLYTILTGEPPRVLKPGAAPVLKRNPPARSIPPALWAVCRKAMAHDPLERYEGAKALADDVVRWLNGEVVSAYPEPWNDRLARWARRHRTLVAASVCVLVVGAGAWILLISRQLEARDQLAVNSLRAFNVASEFADRELARLARYDLGWVREKFVLALEGERKRLDVSLGRNDDLDLEQARGLILFARLQTGRTSDATALGDTLDQADQILDRLTVRQGRTPRILALQSQSDMLRDKLASAAARDREILSMNPKDLDLRVDARVRLAHSLRDMSLKATSPAESWELLNEARDQVNLALAERPDSAVIRTRAMVLGLRYASSSSRDVSEHAAIHREAVDAHEQWTKIDHHTIDSVNAYAEIFMNNRDIARNPDFLLESARIRETFLRTNSVPYESLSQVVRSQSGAGQALIRAGRIDEARAAYRRSIQVARVVALRDNDTFTRQAYFQALCQLALAGPRRELASLFEEATRVYEGLADRGKFPESITGLAEVWLMLGETRFRSGSPDARAAYEKAVVHASEGLELLGPGNPDRDWFENVRREANERLKRIDELPGLRARMPAVAAGLDRPRNSWEAEQFAWMCFLNNFPAASARIWGEMFAADPTFEQSLESERRLWASIAALAAGTSKFDGGVLSVEQRAALRDQALRWMEAELEAWRRVYFTGDLVKRGNLFLSLLSWRIHDDLDCVREPSELSALPEAEQARWKAFWGRVDALFYFTIKPPELPKDVFAR